MVSSNEVGEKLMDKFQDINEVAKLVGLTPKAEVEKCKSCESEITESNPLIDSDRYTANDFTGYCESCYDPTPIYPKID